MEDNPRPRRRNVSIKIDQSLNYDYTREERKKRGPSITRSLFSGLRRAIKAPFIAIGEARRHQLEIKNVESHYQPKTFPRPDPLKLLSTDNIFWKLIYPLPVKTELSKISSDLDFIKAKLQVYDIKQLKHLKIHAQGLESRSQVAWAIYVVLLFAIGLYGHNFIMQPYFLVFFSFCLLAVLVLLYRYIRSRFLVSIVKGVIDHILTEENSPDA